MGEILGIIGGAAGLGVFAFIFKGWLRRSTRQRIRDASAAAHADAAEAVVQHQQLTGKTEAEAERIDDAEEAELAALIDETF